MDDDTRARLIEAGKDPDDPFIKSAVAAGWRPWDQEQPQIDPDRILDLCQIESGVPYPGDLPDLPDDYDRRSVEDRAGYRIESIYPMVLMAVDDSFVLPLTIKPRLFYAAARYHGTEHGIRFSFRRGRCWRIA